MKKLSLKRMLVLITLFAVLTMVSTSVNATGAINPLNIQGTSTNTENTTTNSVTNITTNTTGNTITNTTTNTVSNYQNTNLPQTGDASDYILFLIIAVCLVVAIYAYKQYRNYNI